MSNCLTLLLLGYPVEERVYEIQKQKNDAVLLRYLVLSP